SVVEVKVVVLDVLAAVAFARRQSEESFFENRIAAVPECRREHQQLIAIAESADCIFSPSERLAPRLFMRDEVPGVAVDAVVLAHRAPRAIADVAAPLAPARQRTGRRLGKAAMFGGVGREACALRVRGTCYVAPATGADS